MKKKERGGFDKGKLLEVLSKRAEGFYYSEEVLEYGEREEKKKAVLKEDDEAKEKSLVKSVSKTAEFQKPVLYSDCLNEQGGKVCNESGADRGHLSVYDGLPAACRADPRESGGKHDGNAVGVLPVCVGGYADDRGFLPSAVPVGHHEGENDRTGDLRRCGWDFCGRLRSPDSALVHRRGSDTDSRAGYDCGGVSVCGVPPVLPAGGAVV